MIVEVIAVGTELLIGQIVNSNAAVIGERIAAEGFDAHYQVTVGDNLDRLIKAIRTALDRADAVLLTGGMGPTPDDLTREAICAATGRPMKRDDDHAERIRERILARRGSIAPSVLRMADYPAGADPLPNPQGVALGVALRHEGRWIFAVPGVPREMASMLDDEVLPRLRAAAGTPTVLRNRVLHTWGYGESQVAEILGDLFESANPSIAFLISDMDVKVRITAKAADVERAEAMIAPVEAEVRHRLGNVVFATDDETNLGVIGALLEAHNWTVAVGEVGTAGQVGARLASSGLASFAGAMTLPVARDGAGELAALAMQRYEANVGLGISAAEVVEDAGSVASVLGFAVTTPQSTRERSMRFFGEGERAASYAAIAALHLLRLGLSGDWWTE